MTPTERGAAALVEAEAELKRLAAEAIAAGEWEAVRILAGWASTVHDLLPATDRVTGEPEARMVRSGSRGDDHPATATVGASTATKAPSPLRAPRSTKPKVSKSSESKVREASSKRYPRFVREGDHLIKIGWSKKERSEYEHRAHRSVLDEVVRAIDKLAGNGGRFSVEQLLPVLESAATEAVPNYQTYLCIAWLREHNLLEQHGRQGYSAQAGASLQSVIVEAWTGTERRA
jgi:hypothetical protein